MKRGQGNLAPTETHIDGGASEKVDVYCDSDTVADELQ